jgi:hypothetical protein
LIATGRMKLVNIACLAAYRVVVGNPEGKELGVVEKLKEKGWVVRAWTEFRKRSNEFY